MTALKPTRAIGYQFNQQTPSGDVHKYIPGGVINVSNDADVKWLIKSGDWALVNQDVIDDLSDDDILEANELIDDDVINHASPDLDAMTKDELIEFAETQGIEINPRDRKDDIRLLIELWLDEMDAS